jgi:hypothetical protein
MITPTLLYSQHRTIDYDRYFPAGTNRLTIKDVDADRRVGLGCLDPPDHVGSVYE